MEFFYSASTMGYGIGYRWHKKYNFPSFPRVTRTLTLKKKRGIPFAILKFSDNVWNKVSLHNIGFWSWMLEYVLFTQYNLSNVIASLAGTDEEIELMINYIEPIMFKIKGIELNFSCPNVKSFNNKKIPKTKYPLYLKLNYNQDPYEYDLDNITGIRMNSVPGRYCGAWSGKKAQKYNWPKIKMYNYQGLNVAGCSITSIDDIKYLKEYCGCKEIGIGSIILTNPKFVEKLKEEV